MRRHILLAAALITLLLPSGALAAPQASEGQEYVVAAGDWLSKIAGEYYGDILAYPAIVRATNAKASVDDSFVFISNPDAIEIGQKLWIPTEDESEAKLSTMDLMNSAYAGIYKDPVQLRFGEYAGEPFVPGGASRPTVVLANYGFGDLNGDGTADGAVILVENSGGSGSFNYLAAVVSQDDDFVNAATLLLGDRWKVQSLSIGDGEIILQSVTHGPDDPMCCPSLETTLGYALQADQLIETTVDGVRLADLQNGTYEWIYDEPVQLTDGKYEGQPFVEGGSSRPTVTLAQHAFGDLNDDGLTDAVVALVESSGGSGSFWYLAAMVNEDGQLTNVTTQLLGDRWQIRKMSVDAGKIQLNAVTHGPDDPLCCPSVEIPFEYALRGNLLWEDAPHAQGIYKGFLPAATCCGRDITLYLNVGNSANLQTDYLNGQPRIVETGMWEYGQGGAVVLTITGQPGTLYKAADVITYTLADGSLTPRQYDDSKYGSLGPGQLLRFQLLGWEGQAPPYDEAAASKAATDSGFVGIYKAFLPAATCCGQDITLSLSWDGVAELRTDYLNGEAPLVEVGTWEANDREGLTLTITGQEGRPYERPQIIDLVWESGRLVTPKDETKPESLGMTLYLLNGIIAAVMGE